MASCSSRSWTAIRTSSDRYIKTFLITLIRNQIDKPILEEMEKKKSSWCVADRSGYGGASDLRRDEGTWCQMCVVVEEPRNTARGYRRRFYQQSSRLSSTFARMSLHLRALLSSASRARHSYDLHYENFIRTFLFISALKSIDIFAIFHQNHVFSDDANKQYDGHPCRLLEH